MVILSNHQPTLVIPAERVLFSYDVQEIDNANREMLQATFLHAAKNHYNYPAEIFESCFVLWQSYGPEALREILSILFELKTSDALLYRIMGDFLLRKTLVSPLTKSFYYHALAQLPEVQRRLLQTDFQPDFVPLLAPPFLSLQLSLKERLLFDTWRKNKPDNLITENFRLHFRFLLNCSLASQKEYFEQLTPAQQQTFFASWLLARPLLNWQGAALDFLTLFVQKVKPELHLNEAVEADFWRYLVAARQKSLQPVFQWEIEHHFFDMGSHGNAIMGVLHAGMISGSL